MPKATFYTHVAQVPIFTCRLIARAIRDGGRILVWSDSFGQLQELDKMLWQYEAESFIPHEIWETEEAMPSEPSVLLACGGNLPRIPEGMTVLNLSDGFWNTAPVLPARVLEIVGNSLEELADARERFTAYRRSGFAIEHHGMEGKA
ncbi:TPA: DNA polymerase III subunit chi [Neisseria meningitidis]|jgi:DNA polymerase III, chi subunit (EC 2.7.7.7)|uniref:DNA polymerase holoenzyme chi subunit n=3 Tax=Neisseria meningitidis serogroup B TaxID=491 RepID=Q9JYI7_NEIMB|nr:DNA polymerase III subunit chi [Neisseria meningitidis]AAF41922.1 putative DNA polymerase holoenzyme chi subunit [Neisseria meningitidis MC58]ADY95288.1 DNA polymerase III, chi subunit [Neisseria meningitidis H44/76]ARC07359.1 DNA polymerase III subunit chi [Neisseria meningitidis]ELK57796.1 DNA polymerase III chi subunit, HolC family protein [Neisseria meningitidis NM422]ELK79741.1 DNA polymerase III chi subunit, HolC family protein [Neisseria meningitidis M13255]